MEVITEEEIQQTQKELEILTEADIRKMMKTYQKKQTALLVYTAAVAEREELNEDEYDVLISATLLIWQTMRRKFPTLKKVRIKRMEELDDRLFAELESMLAEPDEKHVEFILGIIQSHPQPYLLGKVCVITNETEDTVRDELKGILFFTAKNVLDALIETCES